MNTRCDAVAEMMSVFLVLLNSIEKMNFEFITSSPTVPEVACWKAGLYP